MAEHGTQAEPAEQRHAEHGCREQRYDLALVQSARFAAKTLRPC
jgi:hypothetical protein